jgi:hypothetical protein
MAALATCHRQAGDLVTCASLFESLYGINERQSEGGAANQSGVMLARTLADVLREDGKYRWVCLCCSLVCLCALVCVCARVCALLGTRASMRHPAASPS